MDRDVTSPTYTTMVQQDNMAATWPYFVANIWLRCCRGTCQSAIKPNQHCHHLFLGGRIFIVHLLHQQDCWKLFFAKFSFAIKTASAFASSDLWMRIFFFFHRYAPAPFYQGVNIVINEAIQTFSPFLHTHEKNIGRNYSLILKKPFNYRRGNLTFYEETGANFMQAAWHDKVTSNLYVHERN